MNIARGRSGVELAAVALVVAVFTCAAGCTSTQENTWYFAAAQIPTHDAAEANKPVQLKFYRVKVKAYALNGKTELLTGLYPADALHDLFGEVKKPGDKPPDPAPANPQPSEGQTPPKGGGGEHDMTTTGADGATQPANTTTPKLSSSIAFECNAKTGELSVIPANARFTVLYGVNAQAIAQQISSFADADTTGNQLGSLLVAATGAGPAKISADAAEKAANDLVAAAAKTGTALKKAVTDTPADAAKIRTAVVTAANDLLKAMNSQTKITDNAKWADSLKEVVKTIKDNQKAGQP